eukprot:203633-Chlamydomonas_euryale.AAC.1
MSGPLKQPPQLSLRAAATATAVAGGKCEVTGVWIRRQESWVHVCRAREAPTASPSNSCCCCNGSGTKDV